MPPIVRLLLIGCVLWPTLAQAQLPGSSAPPPTATTTSPEYQKLVDDAIQEFRVRNFAEARSLFARANAIFPNARTLRGIGMAELELGNYADSAEQLRAALDAKARPLEGPLRAETEALLTRAESFIARLVVVSDPVAPSTIVVDGVIARLREGNALLLTVGDHALEFHAQGFVPFKIVKKIQGGERETLTVHFQRQDAAPLPPVAVAPEPSALPLVPASMPAHDASPRRPLYKNPWLWTGVGVLVAGAAVGLALGLRKDAGTEAPIVMNPIARGKGP
ncbi:MAG: tetratricopeptide repeat protein [Polyangiales bacterium]